MTSPGGKYENIHPTSKRVSKNDYIRQKVEEMQTTGFDDPIAVIDIEEIIDRYRKWCSILPRVTPFYAMKANSDKTVMNVLADLGCSFDCASKNEIRQVIDMGVDPGRIVYAHPCKQISFLKYARDNNIDLMTFDNDDELVKIERFYSSARLLLRFRTRPATKIKMDLGKKFGCALEESKTLLLSAKIKGLNVVGVSFHVGSGCQDIKAFQMAIEDARVIFNIGEDVGFDMTILDIGGGFPGRDTDEVTIEQIASAINQTLEEHFPEKEGVEVIAEPGRYLVEASCQVAACVTGRKIKRVVSKENNDITNTHVESVEYHINEGIHGTLGWVPLKLGDLVIQPLQSNHEFQQQNKCSIWGATCNAADLLSTDHILPLLEVGDWVTVSYMGAYSSCLSSDFNGMPHPFWYYICSTSAWSSIKKNDPFQTTAEEEVPQRL